MTITVQMQSREVPAGIAGNRDWLSSDLCHDQPTAVRVDRQVREQKRCAHGLTHHDAGRCESPTRWKPSLEYDLD